MHALIAHPAWRPGTRRLVTMMAGTQTVFELDEMRELVRQEALNAPRIGHSPLCMVTGNLDDVSIAKLYEQMGNRARGQFPVLFASSEREGLAALGVRDFPEDSLRDPRFAVVMGARLR